MYAFKIGDGFCNPDINNVDHYFDAGPFLIWVISQSGHFPVRSFPSRVISHSGHFPVEDFPVQLKIRSAAPLQRSEFKHLVDWKMT